MSQLVVERRGGVAVVTINRPEARNALSCALLTQFRQALRDLDRDETTGCIVLTGAGDVFCAGLDLKELARNREHLLAAAAANNLERALTELSKPVIAAVNGAAATGGFEIALACDIVLASTTAFFIDTHVKFGLVPGWGLSQRLSRQIGIMRAKEVTFGGRPVPTELAERWGLVNRVLPPAELLPAAMDLAGAISSQPASTLRIHKALIDRGYEMSLGDALDHEKRIMRSLPAASREE